MFTLNAVFLSRIKKKMVKKQIFITFRYRTIHIHKKMQKSKTSFGVSGGGAHVTTLPHISQPRGGNGKIPTAMPKVYPQGTLRQNMSQIGPGV